MVGLLCLCLKFSNHMLQSLFLSLKLVICKVNPQFLASMLNLHSDDYEELVLVPKSVGEGLGTKYDWNLWTVPQENLDGEPRPYDMGKAVGGGSIINGMCWNRGGAADFDAWVALGNG